MLTWAIVYSFKFLKGHNGVWLIVAMVCDVIIFQSLAEALK